MNLRLHLLRVTGLALVAAILSTKPVAAQPNAGRAAVEFFENRIRPVLVERCLTCHGETSKGGLRLDARTHLLKGGKSGPAVVPGNADGSLLIRAIRHTDKKLKMPLAPAEPLTSAQVQDFVEWVKLDLPYPEKSPTPLDLSVARRFWSFQPIAEPPAPKVKQTGWPRSLPDAFILAKLEAKGLKPAPPADKQTLLRRATFDLTGLPPTPEEMEAFLADSTPEAYAKAVDRLLASPQYGVKWGRHWLDVARYGDTRWVGAGEDKRWPFAYTYRDWVIRALNEDMPYDRFVTLQLAADQTPGAKPRDQAALGFLTVGRWFTGALPDVIDDQIDVTTRGFLGLSAQCARCHDHKFDPISTKDYYSLYGLFAASRMPVEGMGLMAELAEVAPPPVDRAVEEGIARMRAQEDRFLEERLAAVRNEYRQPEKRAEYLLAAESVVKKTDNDVRALAKSRGLNEHILSLRLPECGILQRTASRSAATRLHFGRWHEFAALAEIEFAAKAAGVADQEKAKKLNRHVAALLSPPPANLAELARRYAQLFAKNDLPEQVTDTDQEALRQVMRGNDAPVQVSPGELGQYLSKEEKDRVFETRRALLARLNALPERTDQYLAFRHEAAPHSLAEVNDFLKEEARDLWPRRFARPRKSRSICSPPTTPREPTSSRSSRSSTAASSATDSCAIRWIEFLQRNADRDDPACSPPGALSPPWTTRTSRTGPAAIDGGSAEIAAASSR